MPRPSPTNNSHSLDAPRREVSGVNNTAPLSNSKTEAHNNGGPHQKWGRGCEILTVAHNRRRISAEMAPPPPEWDGQFGCSNDELECHDFDPDVDELDEENPFDSIDKLLDQQEQEAKQMYVNKHGNCAGVKHCGQLHDDVAISQLDKVDDLFSCHGSSIGGQDEVPTPCLSAKSSQTSMRNSSEAARPHFNKQSVDDQEESNVQSTAGPKRSAKQYSIIKHSTPRFTFQSSVKMKSSFQTPSNRQSLPQRNLFSDSPAPQKSAKLVQRHTFRKSFEREKPVVSDVRRLDCTPSFLPRRKSSSQDPTKDGINHESPHKDDKLHSALFESLRKSNLKDVGQSMTSRSSNAKSGYLIQRLRSLRNNDQRLAMRLRSGRYSNAYSSKTNAAMVRKRRRSGNDYFDHKHTTMSELDVTVSHLGIECVFGDDKSIHVAYIHRFERNKSAHHISGDDIIFNLPCFSWIILSNDVMREQGIADGTSRQLRFYDAVVIPTRSISRGLPISELVESESKMPTIVCANRHLIGDTMATISRRDLDRIISSVEGNQSTEPCDTRRREQLKQVSDLRVASWKDTLAATRKAKIEWKAEKERQEEEKRTLRDAEEAALRENQRRDTLAHADRLLREQTENLRQFRSQQLLVDTIDIRDAQIKEKEQQQMRDAEAEKQWHLAIITNVREAEKKSLANAEIAARKSKELAEDLQRQRDQREELIRKQNQRKRDEEEALIRKIAIDEAKAEQIEAQLKNERRNTTKEEMKCNEILLKMRREQLQKEEQELAKKCEEEVRRQNRINEARIALEQQHFEEKQSMRKILSDRASEDLRQRAMKEFEIFERDQKMRCEKEIEKAKAVRLKQELDKIHIDECRKKQIKNKNDQVEADRELSKLYADQLKKITLDLQELERRKELAKRQQNVEMREAQQQQCQENNKQREEERLAALQQEQKVRILYFA
eukprot:CCRYP_013104-RA/>CCRYP_013104-RA protein AED:0.33 eAED:0.33 QI:0/0/0/1/0/0/2/0/946